ncbi:hypothetical protein HPB52_011902 [Rhipicephalus sanguineus]|uniref:Uncharacterized protein n=1 Tax=Rhipicephalus sanguineus TaxID=34632 RepID=A0A9D4QEH6_RHISA|nr:hypothetical protein HPB52_011902 [Rhipicephalus sanguineus]
MIGSPLGARERSPDPQRLEPGELTPVHQRSSRRLRGDPPEFGPLPTAPATQAAFAVNSRAMASPAASSELIVSPPNAPVDVLSVSQGSNSEALRELVRSIVKEELQKLLQPQVTPTVSTLATIVRDKFGTHFFNRNLRRNLSGSNNRCRNVVYQRTRTLYANPPCTMLRSQPPVATHRLRTARPFKEN